MTPRPHASAPPQPPPHAARSRPRRAPRALWLLLAMLLPPAASGGPMVPHGPLMADAVRSLARIERVRLSVTTEGEEPDVIGLSVANIQKTVQGRLGEAGLEVATADDGPTPVLHVVTVVLTEPRVAEGVAYEMRLSVNQAVRIEGIEKPLSVPTYFLVYTGLEHRADAATLAPRHLEILVGRFLREHRRAREAGGS